MDQSAVRVAAIKNPSLYLLPLLLGLTSTSLRHLMRNPEMRGQRERLNANA